MSPGHGPNDRLPVSPSPPTSSKLIESAQKDNTDVIEIDPEADGDELFEDSDLSEYELILTDSWSSLSGIIPTPPNSSKPPVHQLVDSDDSEAEDYQKQQTTQIVDSEGNDISSLQPQETMDDLFDGSDSDDSDDDFPLSPTVIEEVHTSNDEIFMSGAVSGDDKIETDLSEDDNTHCCRDNMLTVMPFKILRRDELIELASDNGIDELAFYLEHLPYEFVTTCRAVQIAIEDNIEWYDELGCSPSDTVRQMLHDIERRGGVVLGSSQVIYPEDIIPSEHLIWHNGNWYINGDNEIQHPGYWAEVEEQGEVWNEMPPIPYFPR
jgi:hypothetical protein